MKKITFLPVLFILSIGLGLFNPCYADEYMKHLHDQMINHLKANGYQFFNISDGFHTIKPNETVCGEIIKPANAQEFYLTPIINVNKFKENFSFIITQYENFNIVNTDGCFGKWLVHKPSFIRGVYYWFVNTPDIEGKLCIKNVSTITNIDIEFLLRSNYLNNPHKNMRYSQNQEFDHTPIVCGS